MKYFLGLDLGQAADYSALAILEQHGETADAEFHCRHLERWPLKTPYPQIVKDTARLVRSDELQGAAKAFNSKTHSGYLSEIDAHRDACSPVLAIDATGVGAPVVDLFKAEFKDASRGRVIQSYSAVSWGDVVQAPPMHAPAPKASVILRPIQITGGDQVTRDGLITRVPKRDLVSAAQVALQSGKLQIAASLKESQTLIRELQNFKVKIDIDTAHDSYGVWREGAHDDLVLAVALALWVGKQQKPAVSLPRSYSHQGPVSYRSNR